MLRVRYSSAVLGILACCLSACVTLPPNHQPPPQDPWESWNRGVYKFNDTLDRYTAKPIAKGYVRVFPQFVRTGVSNAFANANTPTVFVNDVLQLKPVAALQDLARFALNTTLGLGGIFDPASSAGIPKNDEDFGQTLGRWGVHAGPFVEIPILGPSDLRDAPGRAVDTFTNPRQYIHNNYIKYGLYGIDLVDRRASLLSLDATLANVFDPYAFIRDAYLQRRAYLVSDGKVTDDPLVDPEPDSDTPAPVPPPHGTSVPATPTP